MQVNYWAWVGIRFSRYLDINASSGLASFGRQNRAECGDVLFPLRYRSVVCSWPAESCEAGGLWT